MVRILVVDRKDLLSHYFQGFISKELFDFTTGLKRSYYKERELVENDPEIKQLIPYVIIRRNDRFLVYQRARDSSKYKEKRLQALWSIGIGGHVDEPEDVLQTAIREIREEIGLEVEVSRLIEKGYINDDSNSVGRVHFGIVYELHLTNNEKIRLGEEIAKYNFVGKEKLIEMYNDPNIRFEGWSNILVPVVVYSSFKNNI